MVIKRECCGIFFQSIILLADLMGGNILSPKLTWAYYNTEQVHNHCPLVDWVFLGNYEKYNVICSMKFKNRNWQEEVIPLQVFKTQFHPSFISMPCLLNCKESSLITGE